jgi:hypothetical protein
VGAWNKVILAIRLFCFENHISKISIMVGAVKDNEDAY